MKKYLFLLILQLFVSQKANDRSSHIFPFKMNSGTVLTNCIFLYISMQDQPISTKIQTALSSKLPSSKQKSSKTNSTTKTVKEKSRSLHDASVQSGRYKVISTHRGLKLQELDTTTTTANGTVPSKPDVAVKPSRPTSLLTKRSSKKKQKQKEEIEARQLFSFYDLEHQDDGEKGKKVQTTSTKTTAKVMWPTPL